jgi:hypothetical protein
MELLAQACTELESTPRSDSEVEPQSIQGRTAVYSSSFCENLPFVGLTKAGWWAAQLQAAEQRELGLHFEPMPRPTRAERPEDLLTA